MNQIIRHEDLMGEFQMEQLQNEDHVWSIAAYRKQMKTCEDAILVFK